MGQFSLTNVKFFCTEVKLYRIMSYVLVDTKDMLFLTHCWLARCAYHYTRNAETKLLMFSLKYWNSIGFGKT